VPKDGEGGEEEDFDDAASDNSSERGGTPRSAIYTSADLYFGMSGYLQKSSTHSRHKAIKAEANLWQRRFFGLREDQKLLEYYGSEESFLKGIKPRGQISLVDCVVEDTEGKDLPSKTLAKSVETLDRAGSTISLLIKIRHRNPKIAVYKNSHDLILRAENAADKFRWLQYLKQICLDPRSGAMVSSGWTQRPNPKEKSAPAEELVTGPSQDIEDFADPMLAGHGLGSAVFWSHICRDENNQLLPSPGLFLDEGSELKQDIALRQHTRDMQAYTKLVCETLIMTVPKVIVHCLVDKAREKLGPVIEEHMLTMGKEARQTLLEEAVDIKEYRDLVRQLLHDVSEAEDTVKSVQKTRQTSALEGKPMPDTAQISVKIIDLAGMNDRLRTEPGGLTRRYSLKLKPSKPPVSQAPPSQDQQRQGTTAKQPVPAQPQATPSRPAPQRPTVSPQQSMPRPASGGNLQAPSNAASRVAPLRRPPGPPQRAPVVPQNGVTNGLSPRNLARVSPQPHQHQQQQGGSGWFSYPRFGRGEHRS